MFPIGRALTALRALAPRATRTGTVRMMSAPPGDIVNGRVKWFNKTKGFGFIAPADGGDDVFVHQTQVYAEGYRTLLEDEEVEFTVVKEQDGRTSARNVTGPNGAHVKGEGDGRW